MKTLAEWLARTPKGPAPRKPLKRASRPNSVSKKRGRANREYAVRRKAFLEAHPYCQAYARILNWVHDHDDKLFWSISWISPRSTEIHHMKKPKCKYLNDESTWLSVCRWSHDWIESNKSTARTLGLLF